MILVLFDLSGAFDIVDYDIVVGRFAIRLGIRGAVLQWLNSYLRSRTQTVSIMDAMSVLAEVVFGVRQGSVSEPLLFVIYVFSLSDIVRQHNISMHWYADDAQLCVAFGHKDASSTREPMKSLECCIADIRIWMLRNRPKMNDGKTEMVVLFLASCETTSS